MGTTRMPIRKMYEACKACKENCSWYGTCKRGFENWYSRSQGQRMPVGALAADNLQTL